MAIHSKIEWTDSSWNPLTGCSKISPGCMHCYAERMAKRLKSMSQANYKNGFRLTTHPQLLFKPLEWKTPQIIFVNSMSDLFHKQVPDSFILEVINTIRLANWHVFQVLTKRSERLLEINNSIEWPCNLWMGVSVENEDYLYRIDHLRKTNAKIKFISIEPLLGSIPDLDVKGLDWVIVGGESGPGARPISENWVIDIRDKCVDNNVPFFFKQWGGVRKKTNGRILENRTWDQWPQYQPITM
jgi:protein gp37